MLTQSELRLIKERNKDNKDVELLLVQIEILHRDCEDKDIIIKNLISGLNVEISKAKEDMIKPHWRW